MVRIFCADPEPDGSPERIEPAGFGSEAVVHLGAQPLDPGSRLEAAFPRPRELDVFTLGLAVMPTFDGTAAVVLGLGSEAADAIAVIRTAEGRLAIGLHGTTVVTPVALPSRHWTVLSITVDPHRAEIVVRHRAVAPGFPARHQGPSGSVVIDRASVAAAITVDHLRIAASVGPDRRAFDGRIDLPVVMDGAHDLVPLLLRDDAETVLTADPALVCGFAFRASPDPEQIDFSPQRIVARAHHHPLAAVKGVRWNGVTHDRRLAPAHYSAMHFNADALTDAGWSETRAVDLPRDAASGVYALEMTDGAGERAFATVFVSAAGEAENGLAFLAPTFTYLAYANAPEAKRGPLSARGLLPAETLLDRAAGRFGRSLYERFRDGSGVVVTGERKPLPSIGPDHRLWGLPADTLLLDRLDRDGTACDLITDHDLHRDGLAALHGVRVLLTGAHPEYWTTAMWDALSEWLARGGRLLYLGGNGFYWRTAVSADGALEVRRAEDGTRPFIGEPAEYVHAFADEVGGLWRRLGRAPQALVGVGMAAQGFPRSTHYRKARDGADPAVAWVFDGIEADDFGHGGLMGGGASGYEIDRYDPALGSDPNAWLLATSEGHAPEMLRTKEELLSYMPPFEDKKSRSDMVLSVGSGGGAVFAVGSIAWIGSLAAPVSDGAAARITANVIRRFLDPHPLPRRGGTA
jgi:N,N-dimethylformamidase